MQFQYDNAGRTVRSGSGDCVCRAITIATGLPYDVVYGLLAEGNASERSSKRDKKRGRAEKERTARNGIHTTRAWFKRLMQGLQFVWTPTMTIGSGCVRHLADGELPHEGRHIISIARHLTALVDNVIHDMYDPRETRVAYDESGNVVRQWERCVYGYWTYVGAYPMRELPPSLAR